MMLENQQRENRALRDILVSRGIVFENELDNRMAMLGMRTKREENSLTPPSLGTLSPPSMGGRSVGYQTVVPGASSATTGYSPQGYGNAGPLSVSGHSPGTAHYSHSPQGPDLQEFSIKQERGAVPDMPGIFEKEPQLGIDFILK